MKRYRNPVIMLFALVGVAMLPSCAGVKSEAELAEIRTRPLKAVQGLKIGPVTAEPESYQPPSGIDVHLAEGIGTQAYIVSGGSNIIGAVAGGVVRGIASGQQEDFEKREQQNFEALKSLLETETPSAVREAVLAKLKPTVLGPRLGKKPTDSLLTITIQKFGLVRVGVSASEEVLLAPELRIQVATTCLETESGGVWRKHDPEQPPTGPTRRVAAGCWNYNHQPYVGTRGHSLSAYLRQPGLLKAELTKTAEEALATLPEKVATRFGS